MVYGLERISLFPNDSERERVYRRGLLLGYITATREQPVMLKLHLFLSNLVIAFLN